ncbi:DsbC/DsbD-like thiol-disulfide interchange protein [Rhizobium sp. BK313]|jgi:DsbC/DsbD-like thiol-disulfide interchange protein|uniref:protein-disulfide reductase DsbD domain-containing protein n=1 Tax=Rhizobium sp. BK313 TaxID=2587081 RepID=UPI0010F2EAE6|nr:protein-disulfide reductase DsbD domain-containing protein [Rhizobium sp. BK313]MBB3454188.1 DsbC/DsbD-like thiol-disulfide interchange protein [Rhizobium sp. BK313]
MIGKTSFALLLTMLLGTLAAAISTGGIAYAAMSDWADNEGGRMRLVALAPDAQGHIRAALQIEPAPGWITYWREPGEGGIPPQVSPAPESGVTLEKTSYPTPKPITVGAIQEIGYDAPVTLPLDFRVKGKQPTTLDLTAFIGLCKDICIPFQAEFSLPLSDASQSTLHEQALLDAANASLPQAPSPDFAVENHRLSPDAKTLSLHLTLPETTGDAPSIYVTGPTGYVFFKQINAKRDGKIFATDIAIGKLPKNYDIKGKSWGVLVIDGERAIETTLAFE